MTRISTIFSATLLLVVCGAWVQSCSYPASLWKCGTYRDWRITSFDGALDIGTTSHPYVRNVPKPQWDNSWSRSTYEFQWKYLGFDFFSLEWPENSGVTYSLRCPYWIACALLTFAAWRNIRRKRGRGGAFPLDGKELPLAKDSQAHLR